MKDENTEWTLMYDIKCWHCKRFHQEHRCKGKEPHIKECLCFEEIKEGGDKDGRR